MEIARENKKRLLVPAIIFFGTGLVITFTQALHENPVFNAWVIAVFAALFTAYSLFKLRQNQSKQTLNLSVQAVASAALAIAVVVAPTVKMIHLALMIWAAVIVASFAYKWVLKKDKTFLTPAVLGTVFILALAFLARDLPNIVGFFAALTIIIGVYLGIAAFDPQNKSLQNSTDKTGIST